jgi:hypothetical protein
VLVFLPIYEWKHNSAICWEVSHCPEGRFDKEVINHSFDENDIFSLLADFFPLFPLLSAF